MEAEAKALAEEEEKRLAEENKKKEEQKALKKQREKERIEQLKKEGKFLTKAQKEEKARNELKLQQMLAAGIKIGPQEEEGAPKKKVVYDSKKKRGKNDKVRSHSLSFTNICH
jgi:translation initiation factor 5B